MITFSSSCRTGGRAGACFIGEKTALDAVHENCPETAGCDLAKSKGLGKDTGENGSQLTRLG